MDNDLIQISISKVIPAQRWRVLRLISKIQSFPEYIPFIKEATVIEKSHGWMKTKWKVMLDEIPIRWTEEESLSGNTISFRSIEGDFEEFRGQWEFNDSPGGTLVNLNVCLKVGIPAINEFADAYIKNLIARNFQAILDYLERRLISIRYASFKKGDTEKVSGFGIVGHLYNFNHLERSLKTLNPEFKMPSREFIGQLFNLTPSFKLYDILNFKSKKGIQTNGSFIVATFIPDMMEKDIWGIFSKVVKACKIAEKSGVGIVTLGGFTSIVAERVGEEISKQVDVPVTTGNTFTSVMAVEGVRKAVRVLGLDLYALKVAVVGGTGDIGSACARALAPRVKKLTITGRSKSHLQLISKELSKMHRAAIEATTDNHAAVIDADIVISAASATSSILKVDWFKPGAIVCDVGYPKNLSYAPSKRRDILVFSGGLAKAPTPVNFPIDIGLPSPDTLYGCFSESIILSLEKRYENYSFGRGNITTEKMQEIKSLGKKHGFEVADFYWGNNLVSADMIDAIKGAIHER